MLHQMNDWYVEGNHWILCRASVTMGIASVVMYDGTTGTGRAHRGKYGYGWIVEGRGSSLKTT